MWTASQFDFFLWPVMLILLFEVCCSWEISPVTHLNTNLYLRVCFLEKTNLTDSWWSFDFKSLARFFLLNLIFHCQDSLLDWTSSLAIKSFHSVLNLQSLNLRFAFIRRPSYLQLLQGERIKNLTSLLFLAAFTSATFLCCHWSFSKSTLFTVGLRLLMVLQALAFNLLSCIQIQFTKGTIVPGWPEPEGISNTVTSCQNQAYSGYNPSQDTKAKTIPPAIKRFLLGLFLYCLSSSSEVCEYNREFLVTLISNISQGQDLKVLSEFLLGSFKDQIYFLVAHPRV